MDGISRISYSIIAGIAFSLLILGLHGSQDAYAGIGNCNEQGVCHVWSGGDGSPLWSDPDNWFDGNVPGDGGTTELHPIYIGCDFAPTPEGEGPPPTDVSVVMPEITVNVVRNGAGGMLNLCEGSTLTNDGNLRFIVFDTASPILVDFTNFGNIINNGLLEVLNNFDDNADSISVLLDNQGTITNNGEINVENNGRNTADVTVKVINAFGSTITNPGSFSISNNDVITSQSEINDVQVLLDNDGTLNVVNEGRFTMSNFADIENVGEGSGGINLNIITDNDGEISVSGDSFFTMQNTGAVTNDNGDNNNDVEVNIQFLDSTGDLIIGGDGPGSVLMTNTGEINGDENPDLDIEFRDFFGTIDIAEDNSLIMRNSALLNHTGTDSGNNAPAEIQIQFDDINPGAKVLNEGTITMENTGDVEAQCNARIDVEITDNLGLIENSGTITLTNSGDATDRDCDEGDTSVIEVEIDNGEEDQGVFISGTINNEGTIELINSGDAEEIEVEINSEAGSTLTNRDGGEIFLENRGVASDELDVRIDQDEATSSITNECGALIEIEDTSQQIPSLGSFVGIRNIGTITNFGTGEITLNDNGVKTEVDKIVTVGVPPTDPNQIVIFAACKPLEPTKFRLLGHDNVKHEIITINTLTGLASVLGATGFDSGASGLATSRVSLDTAIGTFPKGTHFGVFMDDTPAALASAGETDNGFGVQPQEEAPVDGSWIGFNFFGVGTDASGSPYTFTCEATGCTLTVTDCFARGDIFEVFESAVSQGSTSATASLD